MPGYHKMPSRPPRRSRHSKRVHKRKSMTHRRRRVHRKKTHRKNKRFKHRRRHRKNKRGGECENNSQGCSMLK